MSVSVAFHPHLSFSVFESSQQQIPNGSTYVDYEMSTIVKLPEKSTSTSSTYFSLKRAEEELTYRIPMRVTTVRLFGSGDAYAVCPRCQISLDREYMAFCDVCGQKLNWRQFGKAMRVRVPERSSRSG